MLETIFGFINSIVRNNLWTVLIGHLAAKMEQSQQHYFKDYWCRQKAMYIPEYTYSKYSPHEIPLSRVGLTRILVTYNMCLGVLTFGSCLCMLMSQ